jgi:hypothetical protein
VVRGRVWERAENKKGRETSAAKTARVTVNRALRLDSFRKLKIVGYFMGFSSVSNKLW